MSSRSSGAIAFDVGIEQQQIAASHLHAPDFGADGSAAGFDLYGDRFAVRPDRRLPSAVWLTSVWMYSSCCQPVAVEALAEISLAVKQADADQRNVQVRGALDVIAGQHAQAAGIDRQRLVQAELGREISHRTRPQTRRHGALPRCGRLPGIPAGGGRRS